MNKKNILLITISLLFFCFNLNCHENYSDLHDSDVYSTEIKNEEINKKSSRKEITVIESETIHNFNPQTTAISNDNDIIINIYEGLFTPHPITLEPQFAIATDYKISRDKKRWVFTIRDNAKFSNGKPIKSADVRNSWIKLLETPNAPYASLLDVIRGAKEYRTGKCSIEDLGIYATEDNKLTICLNNPTNYLPKVLCHHAFSVVSNESNVFSGPYVISEVTKSETVLTKNNEYWDSENVIIEKVKILQSDNLLKNAYLFNTGKAQWVYGLVPVEKIIDIDAIQLGPQYGVSFYFFKQSGNNPAKKDIGSVWDYKEFRNAVLEAMPWDILRAGLLFPATTFVYPLKGYPEVSGFEFTDSIEAKRKMTVARKKYNIAEDEVLKLVFEIPTDNLSEKEETAIKESLLPLGIEVTFREIPEYLYYDNVSKSDADLFVYSWVGDFADPLTFLELFHGDSTLNESGWHNEEYDKLIEDSAKVTDEERLVLMARAESILLDDGMILPISNPVALNIIDPKEIGGWYPNAFDIHMFKYMFFKEEEIKIDNLVLR